MCGLAAIFSTTPGNDLMGQAERLLERAAHRGPDGRALVAGDHQRAWRDPSPPATWSLGHVRLAILDLSPAGLQPMSDTSGELWIVYNGEIYNYVELAAELRTLGHSFRTSTDTEVILAAYRQWGEACVERFIGMFAFVLVDLHRRRAVAARDRLGVKPLYCWQSGDTTVFVSEPKQLVECAGFEPKADRQQVADYLMDSVLGHDPQACMFADVHPIPPAHIVIWPLDRSPTMHDRRCYWNPPLTVERMSWQEAVERTRDLLLSAIRLRLRSDVPVGTCLSGGLDSSTIVGVASRLLGARLDTFSFIDAGTPRDESYYVDAVTRHCGVQNFRIGPDPEQASAEFCRFIYQQDEPVRQMSQYAEYQVMRLARQHGIKVLLNGQGGDEALCGYRKYVFFYFKQLMRAGRWIAAMRHLAETGLRGDRQLLQLGQGTRYAPRWVRRRKPVPLQTWLRPNYATLFRHVWYDQMQHVWRLHEHQWADLRYWSLPVLLRYQDRNSMAHGLESRVPLVDHRFVEFMLRLPEAYFFRRGMTKRLLVEALGDVLPDEVRQRRTKLGFDSPQAEWMGGALGRELERRVIESPRLAEVLDAGSAARALRDYRRHGPSDDHWWLFRVGTLATWLEVFKVEP